MPAQSGRAGGPPVTLWERSTATSSAGRAAYSGRSPRIRTDAADSRPSAPELSWTSDRGIMPVRPPPVAPALPSRARRLVKQ
ncbi:hypothetical protein [Lysobacter gummosus]|uniref:hypothetical protein n=1 Tax=Lysobacter gummosus TaxID=262324 RepID=UPI003642A889